MPELDEIEKYQKFYEANAIVMKILIEILNRNTPENSYNFSFEEGVIEYDYATLFKHVMFKDGGSVELHVEVDGSLEHIIIAVRNYKYSKTVEFVRDHMKYKHEIDGKYDHENGSWTYMIPLADPDSFKDAGNVLLALREIDFTHGIKNFVDHIIIAWIA
jgi:hypothetical protein